MNKKTKSFKEVCKICKKLQKNGKKIVFCHGVYDILARGYMEFLVKAKKQGDFLIVGIEHDNNTRFLKGRGRPIVDHSSRIYIVSYLKPVDYSFIIPKYNNSSNIQEFYKKKIYIPLNPDLVVGNLKQSEFGELQKKQAKDVGIKFKNIETTTTNDSTTRIIDKIRKKQL